MTNAAKGPRLTAKRAREVLSYDRATGVMRWKKKPSPKANRVRIGAKVGAKNEYGYLVFQLDGRFYLVHRVAYLMETGRWPPHQLDHEDLDRSNNRWRNLRPATDVEQQRNRTARAHNRSGLKWVKTTRSGRFMATVSLSFGTFDTALEAHQEAARRIKRLHGAFFNPGKANDPRSRRTARPRHANVQASR